MVLLKQCQLSFNAIHAPNQYCTDEILARKHRLAHKEQACLTIARHRIREDNIAETSVLFWKSVFEEPTLIEHYGVGVAHIQSKRSMNPRLFS